MSGRVYNYWDTVPAAVPGTRSGDTSVGAIYAYDYLDRPTAVVQGAFSVQLVYDALGRVTSTTTTLAGGIDLTTQSEYDLAGRRTKIAHHDGFVATYAYLFTGEVARVRQGVLGEPGSVLLANFAYDQSGRRTALNRTNGMDTTYAWDAASRLASLTQNLLGTADDLTLTFGQYNPAGQIGTTTRSNDSYSFDDHVAGTTTSAANALNQLTTVGGATLAYDGRGNLTDDPSAGSGQVNTYGYSSENLLTSATIGAQAVTLQYDPLLRLRLTSGPGVHRFLWDGADMIAEYTGPGTLLKRYVFAPGVDEPLVEYIGAGTTDRRWLHADERGSIVAVSDTTGAAVVKNSYDEYGDPGAANSGRFQYTGQMWIPEVGLHYYKARFYNPRLGRFMQTDPIGYGAGMNLYAYVGNDPVNFKDPWGLVKQDLPPDPDSLPRLEDIIVNGCSRGQCFTGFEIGDFIAHVGDVNWGGTSRPRMATGGKPEPQEEDSSQDRACEAEAGSLSATIDVGVFFGRGAGFTAGINWDLDSGVISAFVTAREGTGVGLTAGGSVGYSDTAPSAGYSRTRNHSASAIGGYSMSAPAKTSGPVSFNKSIASIGPQVGFEDSSTQNYTESVNLTEGGERVGCQ